MSVTDQIREGMESHRGHHYFLLVGLIAAVEGDRVRLSASAGNTELFEEEQDSQT